LPEINHDFARESRLHTWRPSDIFSNFTGGELEDDDLGEEEQRRMRRRNNNGDSEKRVKEKRNADLMEVNDKVCSLPYTTLEGHIGGKVGGGI